MSMQPRTALLFGAGVSLALVTQACDGGSTTGTAAQGGAPNTVTSTGGNSSTQVNQGGTAATIVGSGGASMTTNGFVTTGGSTTTSKASGSTNASGGVASSTGGSKATGSAISSGGAAPITGGSNAAGGAVATGGVAPNSGGGKAAGGTNAAGSSTTNGLPALHVEGAAIKDPKNKTIVLRGVSLPDIGTLWQYSQQSATGITTRIDKLTAAGMVPHVVRFPVYPRTCYNTGGSPFNSPAPYPIGTAGGTQTALTSDDYISKVLKPAVDYATQKGMYVIIDYHQIANAVGQNGNEAKTFWATIAGKFASYPNVIYEAYNEPIDSSTPWTTFKTTAQGWVDTIRAAAPDNLIIIPSMSWDQKPGDAAASPLDGKNLAYAAHVYPGNWNATFKQQVANAVTKVPVFLTEWGYILNGSDQNLGTSSATWGSDFRTLIDGNGASWTAWVADNSWTPNLFSDTQMTTLSDFGNLTKTWLTATATSDWVK